MIVETREGRLHFTSVGTTVVSAKRLAEHAAGAVLVGEELHRSLIGKINVEKMGDKSWRLLGGGSKGRNAEFLKRFMEERS